MTAPTRSSSRRRRSRSASYRPMLSDLEARCTSMAEMTDISPPGVEIVIPVYNEQGALESSVRTLHAHMRRHFSFPFRITVADNASTDATLAIACALARELPEVAALHLPRKGRGLALRAAWSASKAEVLAYMDVDLSTDLAALEELL